MEQKAKHPLVSPFWRGTEGGSKRGTGGGSEGGLWSTVLYYSAKSCIRSNPPIS